MGNQYLKLTTWFFYIIAFMYCVRIVVFPSYLCCRVKKLTKKYNEEAMLYGIKGAEESKDEYVRVKNEEKEKKKKKKNKS